VWQFQGKFVLIDRAGQVVADQDLSAFGQLPLVVGAGAPAAAAGLLDLLGSRPDLSSRVIAAVRVGERRWNLRLNTGADVLLPEGQEEAALNKLAELQSSIALLDRPLQSVDLRLPDRLVVRPQQPAAKKPT
jgi:cell division protein FtsQ